MAAGYDEQQGAQPPRRGSVAILAVAVAGVSVVGVGTVLLRRDNDQTTLAIHSPPVPPLPGQEASRPAPGEVAAISADAGIVALLETATGEQRALLASVPTGDGQPALQGVALTPNRADVYFSLADGCERAVIRRVSTDGKSAPVDLVTGISPAVSPDGKRLAYATRGRAQADGSPGCFNAISVRDVRSGATRTWRYPADEHHAGALFTQSVFTKIAWAPDSSRLAFTVSYEGDSISVLDTKKHKTLAEALEVVVPDGGGDSRHPTWQATTGRLALVNRAFECCFEDVYTGPPRTLLVHVEDRLAEDLFPSGLAPNGLDFDASGEHLLYVDEESVFRRAEGSEAVLVASGFTAADW